MKFRLLRNVWPAGREADRILVLARELEGLQDARRDGVARGLAVLWDDFVESFGGPDAFQRASDAERSEYIAKVRQIGERLQVIPEKRPYAVAASAMTAYLGGLSATEISSAERQLSSVIVALIDHGHRLQRPGSQIAPGR